MNKSNGADLLDKSNGADDSDKLQLLAHYDSFIRQAFVYHFLDGGVVGGNIHSAGVVVFRIEE